jgi:hypothetical protein
MIQPPSPHPKATASARLVSEYAATLAQRALVYRWFAEHARDEALKCIYTSLWQAVVAAKRAWLEQWYVEGYQPLPEVRHDEATWRTLQANSLLPPSPAGVELVLEWLNELDETQTQLAGTLLRMDLPSSWRAEVELQEKTWKTLRGPLRYLEQFTDQFDRV